MKDPAKTIDCLVAKARQLHSLPAVAMEVLRLTDNPKVDARELKTCIENDPALTIKLLRVVNSSLFGLSREVSDLNQALALLGIKPLKLLVLGFSLPAGLFNGVAGRTLEHYWRHTLTKAVAAREISETVWGEPGDEPFIAGLLQDLGALLLIQELGNPYVRLLDKVYATGQDLPAMETESMGFDHTRLTSQLLDHWGLPEALVEAVCLNTAAENRLQQILHLAELVARFLADGQSNVLGELLAAGQRYHDLSKEQLDELMGNLEEKVRQLADVLSLQLPDGLDYRDLLVQAHRQLADVAASAAEDLVGHQPPAEAEDLLDDLQSLAEAVSQVTQRSKSRDVPSRVAEPAAVPDAANTPDAAVSATGALASESTVAVRSIHAADDSVVAASGLADRLSVAVAACRQSRCALSLLLVELADADQHARANGAEGFDVLRRSIESLCRGIDHPCQISLPLGDAGFAVILPNCDRQEGKRLGNQLVDSTSRLPSGGPHPKNQRIQISLGLATVALPPKNFPAKDLLESAERCLYGSHASGGGVVKSLEIY